MSSLSQTHCVCDKNGNLFCIVPIGTSADVVAKKHNLTDNSDKTAKNVVSIHEKEKKMNVTKITPFFKSEQSRDNMEFHL